MWPMTSCCAPRPAAGQIRVMDMRKAADQECWHRAAFSAPTADATHSPMFHQMEGLVVDKKHHPVRPAGHAGQVRPGDRSDADVKTRLRPSLLPVHGAERRGRRFSCFECGGKGCPLCKHTGWIEVLGGGVVHHKRAGELRHRPERRIPVFAFGIGIERIAMLKYGINNIGLLL